ncbi:MAG: GAF domain-containing protein [Anaerolineales bacterium]|nr:GAF domain-containing protein [Anaerolineales bacterium]
MPEPTVQGFESSSASASARWSAGSLGIGAALEAVLEGTLNRLGSRAGGVVVPAADGPGLVWAAQVNLPEVWRGLPEQADGPLGRALAGGLPDGPLAGQAPDLGVYHLTPVCAGRELLGLLCVLGGEPRPEERAWLAEAGRVLGRLLRAAQPEAGAPRATQEQAALSRIATALTSTLQLDEILTSTIDGIRQILNVEAASLLLLDEERGELIFKKTLGEDPDWIFQYSLQMDRGLVSTCVSAGRPLLVNNVDGDGRFFATVDAVTGFETRSVLCAPLIAHGQVLGAVEVINKRGGPFDLHDQDLMVSMTASVANAIHNARLFHQLTIANADLEASRWEVTRSRNTLRALFDGIPHPIYIVDQRYSLVALNRACAQIAAAGALPPPAAAERNPFAALVGQVCYQALYGRTEPCAGCRITETLFAGQSTSRTERRWAADDQMAEWEISTYPIADERGQTIQAVIFGQDVTEKRRLEASLAQSEKLAAVGQLAAGVAHEINNPLAAIIANTQLLQRELAADDERQESVSLIAMAGDRALQVVRNLLDFARQERYEFAPTDVNVTLQNALALASPLLRNPALTIRQDLSPDLPLLQASQDHLQGVWLNFILNARDALGEAGGEIQLSTRRQAGEVHVVVADTGMGIQPERLNRIFEPFYTTKQAGRGTGLGLYTCHRIVKQHGGQIRVDSQVGRGTVFTVILPLASTPAV